MAADPRRPPKLSLCMIVKDEEKNLERALSSVAGVFDQIVVVDTGSTDGTREVARRHAAEMLEFPWSDDFSAARNVSLEAARGDWIVVMDADETLCLEDKSALKTFLAAVQEDGVIVGIRNLHPNGRLIGDSKILRLFRNRPDIRFSGRIHENVSPSIEKRGGQILVVDLLVFHHFGYVDEEHARKGRHGRNLRLLLKAFEADPGDRSTWYHLGLQYYVVNEFPLAEPLFRKLIPDGAASALAGKAAARLSDILRQTGRPDEAWRIAHAFSGSPFAAEDCQFLAGCAALEAGDWKSAWQVAQALTREVAPRWGELYKSRQQSVELLAGALWLGEKRSEAIDGLERELSVNPDDPLLSELWIRYFGAHYGADDLKHKALQRVKGRHIAPLAVARLMALGDRTYALDLARLLGKNPAFRQFLGDMLFAAGRHAEAALVMSQVPDGWLSRAVCAYKLGDTRTIQESFAHLKESECNFVRALQAGDPVEGEVYTVARSFIELCLRTGAYDTAQTLAVVLGRHEEDRHARLASWAHHFELAERALHWARRAGAAWEGQTVLASRSTDSAERVSAEETLLDTDRAPVWLYERRIAGLRRAGDLQVASALKAQALTRFPHSALLGAF